MAIPVDFTGVDAATPYEAVPPGKYLAAVKSAEEATAKTGAPGVKLVLEVVGGQYSGAEIRDALWFSGAALPFVKQRLEALGVKVPEGPMQLTVEMLIGKRATITCREEDYEGQNGPAKALRVKAYEPAVTPSGSGGGASSRDDDIPFAASWF